MSANLRLPRIASLPYQLNSAQRLDSFLAWRSESGPGESVVGRRAPDQLSRGPDVASNWNSRTDAPIDTLTFLVRAIARPDDAGAFDCKRFTSPLSDVPPIERLRINGLRATSEASIPI